MYLFRDKKTAAMLLVSSLIIGICALAPSLFVIIVLNKYLASGVTATLLSLGVGAILMLCFEFAFRQNRNNMIQALNKRIFVPLVNAYAKKIKQQQKDANKDGKDDATGQPIQQDPATAGQPNVGGKGAAQADAQADDIAARKDAVAQSKAQRGAVTPQDHQLIRNDLAALAQTKDPKIARKIACV